MQEIFYSEQFDGYIFYLMVGLGIFLPLTTDTMIENGTQRRFVIHILSSRMILYVCMIYHHGDLKNNITVNVWTVCSYVTEVIVYIIA